MTVHGIIFYLISALILVATGLAVTRKNMVHAVVYLVFSFFGSALLFYLLGAPLLAALEVIVYAGAIMILFLFIIMMLKMEGLENRVLPLGQWLPAAGLGAVYLAVIVLMTRADLGGQEPLEAMMALPREFGKYTFTHHWLSIEIASLLLLIALFGVIHLGGVGGGRPVEPETGAKEEEAGAG